MRCGEVKKLISAYVDDELDLQTTRVVSLHMKRCEGCARYFERVRAVGLAISRINKFQGDPAMDARLFIGLKAAAERPTLAERIVRAYMPDWRMAAAAGVFAVAMVFYLAGGPAQLVNSTRDFAVTSTETVVVQAEEAGSFWSRLVSEGTERAASLSRSILGDAGEEGESGGAGEGAQSGSLPAPSGVSA